jgi:hypothetical protein
MVKGFKPIIDDKCKILILGTMPSIESIKKMNIMEIQGISSGR